MRKRPQRLLIALAVTAVAVAASLAIIAPLHAQQPTQVAFDFPDGNNAIVSGDEIKQQGTKHTFHIGRSRVIKQGMSLSEALNVAQTKRGSRISGVGVYALDRAPDHPLYLKEKPDRLLFIFEGGEIKWFHLDDNDVVLERGSGIGLSLKAFDGDLLDVKIEAPTTIEAGTEVTFKAVATGELKDEKLAYRWYVDGGEQIVGRGETFKHTFKKQGKGHSVYVDVQGDKGSRGSANLVVDVGKKTPPASSGSGGAGGTGSGGSGGTGSGGTGSGGSGGSTPGSTPLPSPPSSSPLPPPSSSPPPSSPGRGPNLDPSAPSGGTSGQRVEGVLVSVSVPARPSSGRPGQTAQSRQQQAKSKSNGVDWPLVGGISLTALLVILGAVRERRHIRRLLPHPTPQTS